MNDDPLAYRQLLAYIDELNQSVSQLAVAIERKMQDQQYVPIRNADKKGYWSLHPNIDSAHQWRLKMVTRMLVPTGCQKSEHSLLYQILLDPGSAFDFPTILCARVEHPSLTPGRIYSSDVWKSDMFATLQRPAPTWSGFEQENGWCVAKPAFKSRIKRLKGYILNLLDVNTLQLVSEKIVEPLVHSGDEASSPPEPHLDFPGLKQE